MAIAFHPQFEYVAAEVNGEVYILALELLKATAEKAGWHDPKVIAAFQGQKHEGAILRHHANNHANSHCAERLGGVSCFRSTSC